MRDGLDDFGIVHVAVAGAVDGQAEAIRIAGIGQQFLGGAHIVGFHLLARQRAEVAFRQQLAGGDRIALHHPVHDRGAVDRLGNGLAHSQVLQGIFFQRLAVLVGHIRRLVTRLVRLQEDQAVGNGAEQAHVRVHLQLRHVCRRHALYHLHVAGQQGGYARRRRGQHAQADLVPLRLLAPVAVVARQFHAVAALPLHKLVRPGAYHAFAGVKVFGRQTGGRLFGDDENIAEVIDHQCIGPGGLEAYRVFVDDDLVRDHLCVQRERAGTVDQGRRTIERIGHVFGGKLGAVMEFDALAQFEFPGQLVHRFPGLRQAGDQLALFPVRRHQQIEHMHGDVHAGTNRMVMRIHRRDIEGHAYRQVGSVDGYQ